MGYTPDRRPIKVIRFYNGAETTRGRPVGWRSSADIRTELFDAIERAYALGFRRFVLYIPAGRPTGQVPFRLHQWQLLPDTLRDTLMWGIPDWLKTHSDCVMWPYLGVDMTPHRAWHGPEEEILLADHTDTYLHNEFMAGIVPWLDLSPVTPGQMGIGLDNSTKEESRAELIYYAELIRSMGGYCMGEAILDTTNVTGAPVIHLPHELLLDVPCWAKMGPPDGTDGYLVNFTAWWRAGWAITEGAHAGEHPLDGWDFSDATPTVPGMDTTTTEAIALCQNGHLTSSAYAAQWVARGFVLASQADGQDVYVLEGHGITPGSIPDPLPDPPASTLPAAETTATLTITTGDIAFDGETVEIGEGDFGTEINAALATLSTGEWHRIILRGEYTSNVAIDLRGFTAGLDVDCVGLRIHWEGEGKPVLFNGTADLHAVGGRYRVEGDNGDRNLFPTYLTSLIRGLRRT